LSFYESGNAADWKIVGRGTFSGPKRGLYVNGKPTIRFVQIQDGYLSLKQRNFKPDKDISIGEFNWSMGWHNRMCTSAGACPKTTEVGDNLFQYFRTQPSEYVTDEMLAKLTKNELKIVRNYPYAIRGYQFKTKMLADFYKQFFWYKPDETLQITDVKLSAEEEAFINKLKNVEAQK